MILHGVTAILKVTFLKLKGSVHGKLPTQLITYTG
jgi:hypothetical protein